MYCISAFDIEGTGIAIVLSWTVSLLWSMINYVDETAQLILIKFTKTTLAANQKTYKVQGSRHHIQGAHGISQYLRINCDMIHQDFYNH